MYNVAEFADNLERAGEQLHSNDNPAGVLLNDRQVADHLKTTIRNIDSASHRLDEDLEAVQHNLLLRGYFKRKKRNKTLSHNAAIFYKLYFFAFFLKVLASFIASVISLACCLIFYDDNKLS